MKTNNLNLVFSWFNTLIVAIAIIVVPTIATAEGQHSSVMINGLSIPNNVTDGLFTPTESQRFFQAGREYFEREVEIFTFPERYLEGGLLRLEPKLNEQIDLLQLSNNLNSENIDLKQDLEPIFTRERSDRY